MQFYRWKRGLAFNDTNTVMQAAYDVSSRFEGRSIRQHPDRYDVGAINFTAPWAKNVLRFLSRHHPINMFEFAVNCVAA
jgi:hypothetical protein